MPQLAVHLDRSANTEGLKLDRQKHMQPIWGLGEVEEGDLIRFVAEEAGVDADDVTGWDLMPHAVEAPAYLGRDRELVAGPRMDNLLSVHAATAALAAVAGQSDDEIPYIPVLAAFDHEENGSQSDTGADGPLLGTVLERSVFARGGSYEDRARAFAGTVCLSSDTGHAIHPNYGERHDPTHHPVVNGGPILKVNVNMRYATDGSGRAVFAAACEKAGVQWQTFVSNNAMPCGTTIGPITAARHGIQTVDVGVAILSMHSARELCGADDPYLLANALAAFLVELTLRLLDRSPGHGCCRAGYATGTPARIHRVVEEAEIMGLGGCILLIGAGAILAFATDWKLDTVNVDMVGWIMMLVGLVGVFVYMSIARRRRMVVPPTTTVVSDNERRYQ